MVMMDVSVPCPSSSRGHLGVNAAEPSPLTPCASLVAVASILPCPIPSESTLTLAKYTLVLVTRCPPPNKPLQSQDLTYFTPSSSAFLFLFAFSLASFSSPSILQSSVCHAHFYSLQYFNLHMQHLCYKIYQISLLYNFTLSDTGHLSHLQSLNAERSLGNAF